MSLMSRLLTIGVISVNLLFAVSEEDIIDFVKSNIKGNNPGVVIKSISVKDTKPVEGLKGWKAFIINLNISVSGKEIRQDDTIFATDGFITADLISMKTGSSLKGGMVPGFEDKYYSEDNLVYGSSDSKHSIVVFSDPQCPYCIRYVPKMLEYTKKYPKTFAVYYYNYPIKSIHPEADVLSRAKIVAKNSSIADMDLKFYNDPIHSATTNGKTEEEILALFNKRYGTSITLDQISKKTVVSKLNKDLLVGRELMVQGTPTVYIDGKQPNDRNSYKNIRIVD